MSTAREPSAVLFEEAEDNSANESRNPTIGDIIEERLSRRGVLSGMMGAGALVATVSSTAFFTACSENSPSTTPTFSFDEVTAGVDNTHHVANGYNADVLIRWGDKVLKDAPEFNPTKQTAEAQATQFGYNNDFIGFLPLDDGNKHGLLVINHEYTNEELMFPNASSALDGERFANMTAERVAIEMMAHGGSVIEIKQKNGKWHVVDDSNYARRITAETPMRISGPASGHEKMKTSYDTSGKMVRGMINNCAGAMTPWGTWLSCEENFNGYFWGRKFANKSPHAIALQRYGAPSEQYAWGKFHDRFDISKEPNEVNRFGWVVEIDPRDPKATPVKRTALGRFKHEGAGNIINRDGRFVIYQGDDQKFDYVYRYVTRDKIDNTNPDANRDLLDHGTLYVARFNIDGSGIWLPLEHGQGPLTASSGFQNQGDVVINARLASDLLGATKMDRPEDIEANPKTNKVYVMLTNNTARTEKTVDAANPRAKNAYGHIIEITPSGGDHVAPTFHWEILVRCGDPMVAEVGATFNPATSVNGWFANPDNCVIDAKGRLWIATDGNSQSKTGRTDGVWAMETEGNQRGTSKLFFRCPRGAELCGPTLTPDIETFFLAVQHPGQSEGGGYSSFENPSTRWPDFDSSMPPRPSVLAITKKGGGKIAL